ncbi:AAA family ATPase [Paenibacillus sp. 1P07SE]|uniref:AAA family ATPase n=1 Tax=Paenibacillus sp. 1P07SE TaxID=3132209 RepID=UPI0039A6145F
MPQPQALAPYQHLEEYLFDEWIRLDVVLEIEMQRMMQSPAEIDEAANAFRGMYLSDAEARALLDDDEPYLVLSDEQTYLLDQLEARIRARLQAAPAGLIPVLRLSSALGLTEQEMRMLLAALAPHVNRKYLRLYGYLHDDMSSQHLSLDLMLRISSRSLGERRRMLERWAGSRIAFRGLFAALPSVQSRREVSMLAQPLVLRPRAVSYLLDLPWRVQDTLAGLSYYDLESNRLLEAPLVQEELRQRMEDYALSRGEYPVHWNLHGQSGSGKTFHARHLCAATGRALLEWELAEASQEADVLRDELAQVLLEARLQDAIPAVRCTAADKRVQLLLQELHEWGGDVFWMSDEPLKAPVRPPGSVWLDIPLGLPDMLESVRLWEALTGPALALDEREIALLAGKFRFTPGQIRATAEYALQLSDWRQASGGGGTAGDWLQTAAYSLLSHRLSDKAVKMESRLDWHDLILPADAMHLLRQACNRLLHRHTVLSQWGFDRLLPYGRGISMLFTGPPGTGKTMSALVMAKEVRAELYRIDLSRIVSKYIGETEKNLSEIFEQAGQSGAILFFDEADALFGKRSEVKDAHDKYANMETSYLLQKMEEYEGITILATNFAQNLDDAFVRRIQYIIRFPFPDAEHRERLWRSAIPQTVPAGEIDYGFLGETFELTGGPIKNIVLTAAFLAAEEGEPLSMKQLLGSVIQEYKKIGKLLMKDRFGPYEQYWKG